MNPAGAAPTEAERAAVATARRLADEVLLPAALEVDAADLVPKARLDALAEAGLYGLAGPVEAGGLGVGFATQCAVVEALAGGCLATAFVWLQHHGSVHAVDAAAPAVRRRWLADLCSGRVRGGVAITGIRPGAADPVRARPAPGGWSLSGTAPWVTGWRRIDVVRIAALDPDGDILWLLMDAAEAPTLTAERVRLAAVDASDTVVLRLAGHRVPDDRVTHRASYAEWQAADAGGLRMNGSLSLGVAGRCCRLLGPSAFDAELARSRAALDAADRDGMPAARADAAHLAFRAAAALAVTAGARSVQRDQHAQRLVREALFCLVFGSRPPIKSALLAALAG